MAQIRGYRRKTNYKGFLIVLFLVVIGALVYFASQSEIFEKKSPEIIIENAGNFWNPKTQTQIILKDSSSIKSYSILATLESGEKVLDIQEVVLDKPKELKILLPIPQRKLPEGAKISYEISATDWSNSNFFSGNTTLKRMDFTIDTLAPKVEVIASSFSISYGGSALIIFKALEDNLKKLVVSNGVDEFIPFPYLKKGYYAVLMAWPVKNKSFTPTIIAQDHANNQTRYQIAIVKKLRGYRDSTIRLQDKNFGKVDELVQMLVPNMTFESQGEKFRYLNEMIREKDEKAIYDASCNFQTQFISHPIIFERFYPLKGAQVVGSFGDSRHYYYKDKNISNSYHLGLDIASVANAPIIVSNAGKIVLEQKLGIYGNTVVIYHNLGLASLYSHISNFKKSLGDQVTDGDVIAETGSTGWAFGDHLHFSILIQGQFVRIAEWMDGKWIKNNITSVFQKGEKLILRDQK
ncbi:M23 family peptidase [Helicobacter cholecystus]|uniref:M23 family peptidase n=1 Tax=Helicobacter cholecystus TaxID=45498 RepID=A0A3D8IXF1_9HELI|nr:M23 family metallopeptidase [Helicobacter cholecystus]RDU69959.1 M23 family peptidase [Helicobacter cholecystus]VEJ24875.1 putative M23/M37 family peptidase [Helicobacter cholecystus]